MMTRVAAGTAPVADGTGVRFTVFHEVSGPRVFEVPAQILQARFGAPSIAPDDLLAAYTRGQARIHEAASRVDTRPGITVLADSDFEPTASGR